MKNKSRFSGLLAILILVSLVVTYTPAIATAAELPAEYAAASAPTVLKVGAGMKDITPTADMYPITWGGVGGRGYAFIGAAERVYVRVIALQNDCGPISLMVSFDTGKGPYAPDMMDAVAAETGVLVENIFWSTTHTHSVPENKAANWVASLDLEIREDTIANNLGDRSNKNNSRWAKLCQKQLVEAAREAISGMAEAEVGMAATQSNININRDTKFTALAGTNSETAEGFNGSGPSDKTLTTLEFRNKDTKEPIAFIVHYAMHNVLLYANDHFNPGYEGINYTVNTAPVVVGDYKHDDVDDIVLGTPAKLNVAYCEAFEYVENATVADGGIVVGNAAVHPDIGGQVSQYVEYNNPGAVALWMSGAAGDQNPVLRNCMNYPAPYDMEVGLKSFKAGAPVELTMKGGLIQACTYYASIQYVDVKRALNSIDAFKSDMPIGRAYGTTAVPNKDDATNTTMYLTVMRLGDITFAGSPGELYNGIGVAMRDNSNAPNVLVVNHCWPYETNSGQSYFPDDVAQKNNSYRKGSYKIGIINDYMTALVDRLYLQAEPEWSYPGDGTAKNLKTGESVIVGLDGIAGTDDDNRVVNPAGKTLVQGAKVEFDPQGAPFVALGNGFKLYGGDDGKIGTGDDVVAGFGSYAQSDATGDEKDPIDWRLLDINDGGGTAVLISKHALNAVQFNLDANKAGNSWKDSNLRSWMNSRGGSSYNKGGAGDTAGFYDTAFSVAEKAKIRLTNVRMDYSAEIKWDPAKYDTRVNGYNGTTGTFPAYDRVLFAQLGSSPNNESNPNSPWVLATTSGENTQDYVYAISGEEYFEYFGPAYLAGDGWNLVNYRNGYMTATAYAIAQGSKNSNTQGMQGLADSWTRSPSSRTDLTAGGSAYGVFWSGTGSMNVGREVTNAQNGTTYGTIPMINVDLIGGFRPGVSVNADTTSPTGYTATFAYEAAPGSGISAVRVGSRQFGFYEETPTMVQGTMYRPEEWRPGLYSGASGAVYVNMEETEPGSNVWTATVPLPSGAYLYTYQTSVNGGTSWSAAFTDPANPPRINDKTGAKGANSVLFMPYDPVKQAKNPESDYDHDRSYVIPRTDGKKGTVEYLKLDGLSAVQDIDKGVAVYLPYGYDASREAPYKTIYMAHGNNMNELEWMNDGIVPEIMDNLIADGKTEPAVVVTVNNRAYYNFDRSAGFYADKTNWETVNKNLLSVVIPAIEERYNVSKKGEDRAFGGESMGGQNACNLFLKNTEAFGYYAVMSGSYLLDPDWDKYDLESLKKPLVMSSAGLWDTNRFNANDPVKNPATIDNSSRSNEEFEARMDEYGLYYVGPNCVPGAHAFETWHQVFATFVKDYLWTNRPDDVKIVKFDSQGAKFVANPNTKAILGGATTVGALPRNPVKDGFIFGGWNTKADGTGTEFSENTPVTGDVTVYAVWEEVLPVYSRAQLQTLYSNNVFLLQNLYTDESWAGLQSALTRADVVLNTPDATQMQISRAYVDLQSAISGLTKTSRLQDIMLDLKHPYTYTSPTTGEAKSFEMPYRLYLPENYDPSKKYPMLIFLHGGGEGGTDNLKQIGGNMQLVDRIIAEEDDNPCIIVVPQADHTGGERWSTGVNWKEGNYDLSKYPIGPSLSAVYDLVSNYLPTKYSIDMDRLYCSGLSAGGLGTWSLMMYYPELLAAGIPSNGTGDPSVAAKILVDKPIWIFHGGADTSIPVQSSRDMYSALTAAGSTVVKYTEYPGVPHDGTWQRAYSEPDILDWMFSQKKAAPVGATVSSAVERIVSGYAANIPVSVTPDFSGNVSIYAPNGDLLYTKNLLNEKSCLFSLKASEAVVGTYTIKAGAAETAIACVAAPTGLWAPVVTVADGKTFITFAAAVSFNDARKSAKIGGDTVANNKVSANGNVIVIDAAAAAGQPVELSGIKYAELFPSYSFTFTVR